MARKKLKRKFSRKIKPQTRAYVMQRANGVCEMCKEFPPVHMHHFTYERAGKEHPDDLAYICLRCHMERHPQKAKDLINFEFQRSDDARALAEDVLYEVYEGSMFNRQEAHIRRLQYGYVPSQMRKASR